MVVSVDLPMPGEPPSSTSDPGTRPPPRTRSSSPMPVCSRATASARTSRRATGRAAAVRPLPPAPPPPARPLAAAGARPSTSVFHAPQPGHWPCQRASAWPHSEQTWIVVGRGMGSVNTRSQTRRLRPPRRRRPSARRPRRPRRGVAPSPTLCRMPRRPKTPPPLADLEGEVMEQLWALGEATVRDLMDACNAGRAKPRAYTTYLTIMSRLDEKGMAKRRRSGKTDIYRPTWDREAYRAQRAGVEVEALMDQYGDAALTHFARQVGQLEPARRRALQRLARSEPEG